MSRAVAMVCIALINFVTFAMMVRAVMSWFLDESNAIQGFLVSITEPFIIPVRMLLNKLNVGAGMPLDISFLVTFLIFSVLEAILGAYL